MNNNYRDKVNALLNIQDGPLGIIFLYRWQGWWPNTLHAYGGRLGRCWYRIDIS